MLVDDGSSAVALPEVPLLGVLPGTGGLTRLVDKRGVRRDLADVFATTAEGIRGGRAVAWRLADETAKASDFDAAVIGAGRRRRRSGRAGRTDGTEQGVTLTPLRRARTAPSPATTTSASSATRPPARSRS